MFLFGHLQQRIYYGSFENSVEEKKQRQKSSFISYK